jgi:predicted Rdx family selenoprotein
MEVTMIPREVTVVFYHNQLYGLLVEEDEYIALGSKSLADAFRDHHVQLVRGTNGSYHIVDDVSIWERPTKRGQVRATWKLGARQSDVVRDELESVAALAAAEVKAADEAKTA